MKAIFGGAVKKPLMTKVSMRHLNEIVRERNQYSRDTVEAWQDYINLKGRLDTEVSKISKRNNFLVEELESWKQQFLKFEQFVKQLTEEAQDLKVKIETHKRENRRLQTAIDEQKSDAVRLSIRLSGTEKQRDDALEALVLQQEIAEELERERKRNKKELAALQHTNKNIIRQREEAQRVVVHLRSLISGQTHHMEHIVRSLTDAPELSDYIEEGFEGGPDSRSATPVKDTVALTPRRSLANMRNSSAQRSRRPGSSLDRKSVDDEKVSPEMESRFFKSRKRLSEMSFTGVADRHLRDKTDAISNIIRNISEQCAAAVEGLQLAHNAEHEEVLPAEKHGSQLGAQSEDEEQSVRTEGSEVASEAGYDEPSYLQPGYKRSSVPPTPGLDHDRSSTSMSNNSLSTTPDRSSQQYAHGLGTTILEGDVESELGSEAGNYDTGMMQKGSVPGVHEMMRPSTARIVS